MLWFGRSWLLAGVKRCKSLSLWRSWAFILTLNFYLGNLCNKESKSRNGCWRLQLCVPSLDDDMHVWKFKLTLVYMKTGHGSRGKKMCGVGGLWQASVLSTEVCAPARLHLQVTSDSLTGQSQGPTKWPSPSAPLWQTHTHGHKDEHYSSTSQGEDRDFKSVWNILGEVILAAGLGFSI